MKLCLNLFIIILFTSYSSCTNEGYPSMQFYSFNVSKDSAEQELFRVIKAKTDTIPAKWKEYVRSADFMDDKHVYFKNGPEEILRIGFTGDSTEWNESSNSSQLSLFGLFNGNKWIFGYDITSDEEERIKKRLETEILDRMKYSYKKEK